MDCALKYFNAVEREAYQKSTLCQNITNYSFITRHFMMQENTLQSTGYQPVRLYICLQTAQCKVTQPRVGQYHFIQLSKVDNINHSKTYLLYTHRFTKDGIGTKH